MFGLPRSAGYSSEKILLNIHTEGAQIGVGSGVGRLGDLLRVGLFHGRNRTRVARVTRPIS